MTISLLEGLPPQPNGGNPEPCGDLIESFWSAWEEAERFAKDLPIVRTFGPRDLNSEGEIADIDRDSAARPRPQHWERAFRDFLRNRRFDPSHESEKTHTDESVCNLPGTVYFHGGRPDQVYGRCVLVLKDIPSTLLHNVSVTPFGLANLLRDKLAANARLAIEQEQCRFLEINTWDGRTWREQFAIFYDYYLASDPDRYLSPNPDKNSPSKPPGRFRAFYGERVWPDDISDYRAWTIELRLAAELRLEEISTNECELYLPPSILMYWGNKVDKRLSGSVSHLKKRITIREEENAVVEAAVAIKRRLQPEWRRPSKSP